MKKNLLILLALGTVPAYTAQTAPASATPAAPAANVMEMLNTMGHTEFYKTVKSNAKLWAAANQAAGQGMAPFAVFCPTNAAMAKAKGMNAEDIKNLIKLHVAPLDKAVFEAKKAPASDGFASVDGELLYCDGKKVSAGDASAAGAAITGQPTWATNGVVYVISDLLKKPAN